MERSSVLRNESGAFTVTRKSSGSGAEERVLHLPPHEVEQIALVGQAHMTSEAAALCLDQGIDVSWLSPNGLVRGRLQPALSRSAELRLKQYAAHSDKKRRLALARICVAAKMKNGACVLREIQSNVGGTANIPAGIAFLERQAKKAAVARKMDTLLGLEGSAAKAFFAALSIAFRADIGFEKRQRQPPPDPANALLSYGYVLLGNLVASAVEVRGLDSAIGFYHEVRPGKPALALDLIEELRHPLVDRFVLRLCNLRMVQPDGFEVDQERPGGVRMKRETLKIFFRRWEEFLAKPISDVRSGRKLTPIEIIRDQAGRFATDLSGGASYQPFLYGKSAA